MELARSGSAAQLEAFLPGYGLVGNFGLVRISHRFVRELSSGYRRGGCAINKKMRSHRSGADGVVGIDEVFQSAFFEDVPFSTPVNASPDGARASRPSAPLKEVSRLLLDVASTLLCRECRKTSKSAVGAVYDRAYFVDSRKTRGHRPRLQMLLHEFCKRPHARRGVARPIPSHLL